LTLEVDIDIMVVCICFTVLCETMFRSDEGFHSL
jgi:hypothetical protein